MTTTIKKESFFQGNKYSKELKSQALNAVDLTKAGVLTPERIDKYCASACGYSLLYGTERVTDDVLQTLMQLADEQQVFQKMERMQDGDTINTIEHFPSENRKVLHTATRDFFDHPRQAANAKDAASKAHQEIDKLKSFLSKIDKENTFDEMVMIGIGGSDLGPRAHYHALEYLLKRDRKIHFISNVDPDDAASVFKKTNLKRTLVVVISKSGTTLETETNEEFARAKFKAENLNPHQHFISITMPGTPMDNKQKYKETFYVWDWIGGRYSTTSMVGGVVLSFAFGFNVFWEFLRGAHEMDKACFQTDLNDNLPLLAALLEVWNHNFLNYPTTAIIPYSQPLHRFPAHLQQVGMESNGKMIDKKGELTDFATGMIWWGEPGTNAQHSFFQLLHQGTGVIPVCFIGYKESQLGEDLLVQGTFSQEKLLANMFAQCLGLALGNHTDNLNKFTPGNRPSHILLGEHLTPHSLGALLSFWENKVAFIGFIWDINSFDQEGVQLGKVLANKIIDQLGSKHKGCQEKSSYPLGEAFLKHLDRL